MSTSTVYSSTVPLSTYIYSDLPQPPPKPHSRRVYPISRIEGIQVCLCHAQLVWALVKVLVIQYRHGWCSLVQSRHIKSIEIHSIRMDFKISKRDPKWSKMTIKSKYIDFFDIFLLYWSFNQLFRSFNWPFQSFNQLLLVFKSKRDQKWSTLIENRLKLDGNRDRWLKMVIGIGFIL